MNGNERRARRVRIAFIIFMLSRVGRGEAFSPSSDFYFAFAPIPSKTSSAHPFSTSGPVAPCRDAEMRPQRTVTRSRHHQNPFRSLAMLPDGWTDGRTDGWDSCSVPQALEKLRPYCSNATAFVLFSLLHGPFIRCSVNPCFCLPFCDTPPVQEGRPSFRSIQPAS